MRCLYGDALDKNEVKRQKAAGEKIGELRLGESLLIHCYFFSTKYIRYEDIQRVYLRIESGEYGEFPLDECSLVVIDRGGTEHALHVDHQDFAKDAVKELAVRYRQIQTGKPQK